MSIDLAGAADLSHCCTTALIIISRVPRCRHGFAIPPRIYFKRINYCILLQVDRVRVVKGPPDVALRRASSCCHSAGHDAAPRADSATIKRYECCTTPLYYYVICIRTSQRGGCETDWKRRQKLYEPQRRRSVSKRERGKKTTILAVRFCTRSNSNNNN